MKKGTEVVIKIGRYGAPHKVVYLDETEDKVLIHWPLSQDSVWYKKEDVIFMEFV